MKAYSYLLTALSVLAVITGCQNEQATKDQGPAKEIAFKAALGKYEVKATDTAFEEGDVVGLFAADPVSANNVALTWDGETVKPEEPLFWGLDQADDDASAFYAYYPYSEEVESTLFTFSVPEDQSDEEEYKAADLLMASALGTPDVGEVYLRFAHQLTRAIFLIDATALGSDVESVVLGPVKLDAEVDLTIPYVEAAEDSEDSFVKAAPLVSADGTKAWGVIVPPQLLPNLLLMVTLENGEEVVLEQHNIPLEAGVSYTVNVLLDETAIPVSFEFEVFDWIDGGYVYFGKNYDPGTREHVWAVETYDNRFKMEQGEDELYYATLSGRNNYEFRIVREDTGRCWGQAVYHALEVGKDGVETVIAPNDNWIYAYCESGSIQIVLDAVRKVITVKPMPREWVSLGTGKMVDGIVSEIYKAIPHTEIEVEVQKDANSNTYRIVDPYKNWAYIDYQDSQSGDYFTYQDGGEIVISFVDDYNCYVESGNLGLSDTMYGDMTVFSLVPENGVEDYYNYGYYYPKYGYFQFNGYMGLALSGYDSILMVNKNNMFSLTLPGYDRPVLYYNIDLELVDQIVDETGQTWVILNVFSGMDVTGLRYGVYFGKLSQQEITGEGGVIEEVRASGTEIEPVPDGWVELRLPVSQTGTYTLVFDIDIAGKPHYAVFSDSHGVVIEGQDIPELNISVTTTLDEVDGDTKASFNYFFSNPKEIWALLEETSKLEEDGVTEDNIYDYVLSNGSQLSISYISEETGETLTASGLEPDTEYMIVIAGTDNFDQIGWAADIFRTNPAPEFQSIGYGIYNDAWTGVENASVEILKADTTPARYILKDPYEGIWAGVEPYEGDTWGFTGEYASQIEFYIDGEFLHYNPFLNGDCYVPYNSSPLEFRCAINGEFNENNKMIQEGVYNMAPYVVLTYYGQYFQNTYNWWGQNYIVLPGYEYVPDDAAGAPAKRSVRKASGLSPLAPEKTIAPVTGERTFKRHMLKAGVSAPKPVDATHELVINE
ncbi:MAG: fimbrillin family protein [Bacteroidales bacterium]|nr:fimbrillin family protein [Bacteroidales bacterium]